MNLAVKGCEIEYCLDEIYEFCKINKYEVVKNTWKFHGRCNDILLSCEVKKVGEQNKTCNYNLHMI